MAKPLTVDDLWRIERLGTPSLSPDGTLLACTLGSHSMADNTSRSALWLLSTGMASPMPNRAS